MRLLNWNGAIPTPGYWLISISLGTAAMNSNWIFLSDVLISGTIANWPASVERSGLLAKTLSPVALSVTWKKTHIFRFQDWLKELLILQNLQSHTRQLSWGPSLADFRVRLPQKHTWGAFLSLPLKCDATCGEHGGLSTKFHIASPYLFTWNWFILRARACCVLWIKQVNTNGADSLGFLGLDSNNHRPNSCQLTDKISAGRWWYWHSLRLHRLIPGSNRPDWKKETKERGESHCILLDLVSVW